MTGRDLPERLLSARAIVYVRQSTGGQVASNLESQRSQYELADLARRYGFRDVVVIDDDLGRSASGTTERPGFVNLVSQVCEGLVGAVFCSEASRLARNGREWHHLLELCALVSAFVVDSDGVYDPSSPNDRLLLGLKGTMSEFELTLLRKRMIEGARAKARRGELRILVPVGYVWSRELALMMDPDRRVQEAVGSAFRLFDRLGSARQVHRHMQREGLLWPHIPFGHREQLTWSLPTSDNILSLLRNPFYAGAYAYGKTGVTKKIIDGLVRKSYARERPRDQWTALVRDHHDAYLSWEQFEHNQDRLMRNTYAKPAGAAKSGRGGRALLAGLLRCRRCGGMLHVSYCRGEAARYSCRSWHPGQQGIWCQSFGTARPDRAIAKEVLLVVAPAAVEAALMAHAEMKHQASERLRAIELERQQAEYEVRLCARRYEAVDPDNRLVAAELEARWNAAMDRLRSCEARLTAEDASSTPVVDREVLLRLGADLEAAWNAPTTSMRTKQQLVRALLEEIVVDIDEQSREVVLILHWRGGRHSELRVRKPASGEHGKRTPGEADRIVREMATRWSDTSIAATLNRMGLRTGTGKTWNAKRVCAFRNKAGIVGYESAVKDGVCLTMNEAAAKLGVAARVIRKLIDKGILPARQVARDAPWQIRAADLERREVLDALQSRRRQRGRPCRNSRDERTLRIPGT